MGQLLPLVLLWTTALHSWPLKHNHQIYLPEPLVTSSGFKLSFFVGCHSFAIWGNKNFKLFSLLTFFPEQYGQLVFFPAVLCVIDTFHSWPLEHNHQIYFLEPFVTSSGFRFPFLFGCHSFAKLGNKNFKLFSLPTFFPEQYGQLLPFFLCATLVIHSWPLEHNHHTFLPEAKVKFKGVKGKFFL